MPHIATAGTSSCATIAIGSFKGPGDQVAENENYKKDKKAFKMPGGTTAAQFYSSILYPTTQPLGRTHDLPFEKLMEEIENCALKTKLITAVINQYQFQSNGNYWPNELKRWGFKLVQKTGNAIGSTNYLFIRNPQQREVTEKEFT